MIAKRCSVRCARENMTICCVHGGFAGTVQAFVPNDMLGDFKAGMDSVS